MAWLLTWLVHGLAIAVMARLALRALPGLSAATRYALWWAALVLVLILPIVRSLTIGTNAASASAAATASIASAASGASSKGGIASASTPVPGVTGATASTARSTTPLLQFLQSFSLPPVSLPRVPDWLLAIVMGLWLGTVMIGLAQVAYSVQAVRRLKESCRRMVMPRESDLPMWSAVRDRGRAVRVRASDRLRTAAVLGLTRPVIVVPRGAAAALTAHEIDQVVLHEYAHVQRYDDWTKLGQVLIGAFFGWHPAVRLMMREIDFEREAACDDYVVDVTGAPRAYARCLTKVIEMMPGAGLAAIPYASSSANHATTRIERLLDRRRPSGRLAMMPAMAGSATLAVLAFCTVHALPIAIDPPRPSPALGRVASVASAGTVAARDDRGAVTLARTVDVDVAADQGSPATRNHELRIAAASALPIELRFPSLSPLSRLTASRSATARATPLPIPASATGTPMAPNASTVSAARLPAPETAAVPPHGAHAAPSPAAPAPAPETPRKHAADSRPGVTTRQPASAPDVRDETRPHADTSFALGPVVSATDSDALPEASDGSHIQRGWENTRDATSKAVGVAAQAVGTATKTAGDATMIATSKAASSVKVSSVKAARAVGRGVKRTLASVF